MNTTKVKLTNILVFTGFLFTTARMIRGTDNLYFLALLSFTVIWILNYKLFWDLNFKQTVIWFLPFGVWALISAIWSLEPIVSATRGVFYIFIMLTAVLVGNIYKNNLHDLFKILFSLNALFIMLSYISLVSGIPSDAWTANHGMGFTSIFTHQNTLAAVLMFTLIGPLYFLLKNVLLRYGFDPEFQKIIHHSGLDLESKEDAVQKRFSKTNGNLISEWLNRDSIFSLLLILSNFYFIYLSYSRAVMLALFFGGLTFIYLLGTIKFNLIFTLAFLITFGSIYYLFEENVTKYLKKSGPDYLGRRMILWEPSYKAALNGGVIGLGYGVTDPTVESSYKKENRLGELKREKGNSILALIEEVGFIGVILFLLPLIYSLINNFKISGKNANISISNQAPEWQNKNKDRSNIIFAFLIAFFIHAQFEAWWVGYSSIFLLIFLSFLSYLLNIVPLSHNK